MTNISSTDAVRSFGDCLAKIKHAGESFQILKNNVPIARLLPAEAPRSAATVGDFVAAWGGGDQELGAGLQEIDRGDQAPEDPWGS